MKNLQILLITASLILPSLFYAQNTNYGLKGGINISNLAGGDVSRNNLFGFHIGGLIEFELNNKFSIQPEIMYSTQGSEVENELKVKIDYLTIPITAKYYLSDKFSLEAGPQLSFLVNDKIKFNDSSIPDAETDASSFDFGLNLGLGYKFSNKLFTSIRYNLGILPVSESPDIRNSILQLSLGYSF